MTRNGRSSGRAGFARAAVAALGAMAVGCAAPAAETEPGAPPIAAAADTAAPAPTPPATGERSLGFLEWEDLGVRLVGRGATAGLRIDITTLDEEAVDLAGEDVRSYFQDLRGRIADTVPAETARQSRAFLVAFSGFEKEVRFDPTRLQIRSEGSTYYPRQVVPVSSEFDRRLVGLYETVYAIYLFPPEVDLLATLEFQYGDLSTGSAWRRVVEAIQRAKTRRRG